MQRKDLSGKKFGRLIAIKYEESLHKWFCKCDCGNTKYVSPYNLERGTTRSCGCLRFGKKTSKLQNLSGKRFGTLTVIKRIPPRKWLCKCDCGNMVEVFTDNLTRGHTQSCGCQKGRMITQSKIKHGRSDSKEYNIWENMKSRCRNPKNKEFDSYGGRGITVCNRWLKFSNFYSDMGTVPKGMTLDRIDVNGNYEPSNCRWASSSQQNDNKRHSQRYLYGGETHTLLEWSKIKRVSYSRLSQRIKKLGWSIEKALDTTENLR